MRAWLTKWTRRTAAVLAIAVLTLLAVRIYDTQRGAPLEPWHTFVPHEMKAAAIDRAGWDDYLKAEDKIFAEVRHNVSQRLAEDERIPINRFFEGSPVYPEGFAQDWNRSYVLEPEGPPAGAVVFLHGLTDSPYSLRHIARRYRDHGFVSVAIRLPAHGTVPGALTSVEWQEWTAATRLAVREARRRIGPALPLHIIGFSNGGALALKYALEAIENPKLTRPDRLVLISPMIGITRFARFAGIAALPAIFPAFAKAAWLSVTPEFNPFKYNSFPVNGARQSYLVTHVLQEQITRLARERRLEDLAPILTFQSVVDFTVSTRAIVSALYEQLPANGSELVLFDVNRSAKFGQLLRTAPDNALSRLLPATPRRFRSTIIANADPDSPEVVERVTEAGSSVERTRVLGLSYPPGVFSLSHVAVPFPLSDSLYGLEPDPSENFGVNLGAVAPRGERGGLIISLDALLRMSSNPFFPYMIERIEEGLRASNQETPGKATTAALTEAGFAQAAGASDETALARA
ncbi:alpha/beta hydrolase [Methylocapsa palsarum]|uniref:Lysophospholipase, alpha-beta hydrolase superfamily n=1 Tax=Methylocapsa palsarum TaxID=1612308 RepID=A0A1I3W213_9HYPH|nr:alpha/beta hydrolase [Methylocapsa palsarum]SFK01472.1 Lysophospholipase, alpha-beta hydrolase superfamily [Methylocapsa palsarum]